MADVSYVQRAQLGRSQSERLMEIKYLKKLSF